MERSWRGRAKTTGRRFALPGCYDLAKAVDVEISMPASMINSAAPPGSCCAKTGVIPRIKNPIRKMISLEFMTTS